jgi:hypothetical protein
VLKPGWLVLPPRDDSQPGRLKRSLLEILAVDDFRSVLSTMEQHPRREEEKEERRRRRRSEEDVHSKMLTRGLWKRSKGR